jgi:hypothetical protein
VTVRACLIRARSSSKSSLEGVPGVRFRAFGIPQVKACRGNDAKSEGGDVFGENRGRGSRLAAGFFYASEKPSVAADLDGRPLVAVDPEFKLTPGGL